MSNKSTPGQFNAWLLAMRPKTLPAAIAPIAVAAAIAVSHSATPDYDLIALAFVCALALQVLVNFANDYFDAKSGVDTAERKGPIRATQSGLISERGMVIGICLATLVSIIAGIPLIVAGGLPFVSLGILCILAALAYSGGPLPLASHGLGEVTVFVFFGLVAVVGGSYLFTGELLDVAWWQACIVGAPISAIMLVNNTRDIDTDQQANKLTLAVRLGRRHSEQLFSLLVMTPAIVSCIAWGLGLAPWHWLTAGAVTMPLAMRLTRLLHQSDAGELNIVLAKTAQYSLITALAFAAAILMA
ncbi:1,4-dihydroxy-2-naphthoate octaprenyltransferase [Neiella marina]|uniref:1,4-dihydroxy-2-naphthoate octaprenyltransferase n=1 Tax=Neiella marina TaxID=508461 RepID=A0A8J2U3J8_9GAMM|nr:1,4-dihydroxy-2-naphthoate polyprenyltransferase [Neiella marina]GGA70100.1 1,4-dihydroxy-2-naphthoate octaprenyltransferase [Neiella marina]